MLRQLYSSYEEYYDRKQVQSGDAAHKSIIQQSLENLDTKRSLRKRKVKEAQSKNAEDKPSVQKANGKPSKKQRLSQPSPSQDKSRGSELKGQTQNPLQMQNLDEICSQIIGEPRADFPNRDTTIVKHTDKAGDNQCWLQQNPEDQIDSRQKEQAVTDSTTFPPSKATTTKESAVQTAEQRILKLDASTNMLELNCLSKDNEQVSQPLKYLYEFLRSPSNDTGVSLCTSCQDSIGCFQRSLEIANVINQENFL